MLLGLHLQRAFAWVLGKQYAKLYSFWMPVLCLQLQALSTEWQCFNGEAVQTKFYFQIECYGLTQKATKDHKEK